MKKKIIILIPVLILALILFLMRGGSEDLEFADKQDDVFLFGENIEENEYEIEYLEKDEHELTKENPIYNGDVSFEMSSLLNDEITLSVQKVDFSSSDVEINAYDFKTNEKLEGVMTISIPYTGEIAGAGYYNEENKTWEPVMFSID